MIQLLFYVITMETALILLLLLKNPFKKFGLMGLDRVKRGRGPTIVKTIAATVFMVLCSDMYSIIKIHKRTFDVGTITPTDEVLMGKNLLEVCLLGFSLLLGLIIDRAHHYLRELRTLRQNVQTAKKQDNRNHERKSGGPPAMRELEEEIFHLRQQVKQLESALDKESSSSLPHKQLQEKISMEAEIVNLKNKISQQEAEAETMAKGAKAAETTAEALRKQSEGLLTEYNRLLEENAHLRSQLQSIDWNISHMDGKKNI